MLRLSLAVCALAFLLASGAAATGPAIAGPVQFAGACSANGPFQWSGIMPRSSDRIEGDVRNSIGALAVLGMKYNCTPVVTCVAIDSSKPSAEDNKLRCKAVREILVRSRTGADRSNRKKAVILVPVRPGKGLAAGTIQLGFR